MKKITPNPFTLTLTLLTVAMLVVSIFSCKKDDDVPMPESTNIMGSWYQNTSPGLERHINFYRDSVRITLLRYSNQGVVNVNYFSGTFSIEENKLRMDINETVTVENNKVIARAPYTGKFYENATFVVKGNKLTLSYTTYPADAPIATSTVFNRVLPD